MNPGANLTAIFCRFEEAEARDDSESDATVYYPQLLLCTTIMHNYTQLCTIMQLCTTMLNCYYAQLPEMNCCMLLYNVQQFAVCLAFNPVCQTFLL